MRLLWLQGRHCVCSTLWQCLGILAEIALSCRCKYNWFEWRPRAFCVEASIQHEKGAREAGCRACWGRQCSFGTPAKADGRHGFLQVYSVSWGTYWLKEQSMRWVSRLHWTQVHSQACCKCSGALRDGALGLVYYPIIGLIFKALWFTAIKMSIWYVVNRYGLCYGKRKLCNFIISRYHLTSRIPI